MYSMFIIYRPNNTMSSTGAFIIVANKPYARCRQNDIFYYKDGWSTCRGTVRVVVVCTGLAAADFCGVPIYTRHS